jgi:hypothetical protein
MTDSAEDDPQIACHLHHAAVRIDHLELDGFLYRHRDHFRAMQRRHSPPLSVRHHLHGSRAESGRQPSVAGRWLTAALYMSQHGNAHINPDAVRYQIANRVANAA